MLYLLRPQSIKKYTTLSFALAIHTLQWLYFREAPLRLLLSPRSPRQPLGGNKYMIGKNP